MKIGNIEIKNKVVLAPMAGVSNPAYMKIASEMGVGLAYTELISAEAIVRHNKKTLDMLKGIETLDIPVGIQLFGGDSKVMAEAAKIVSNLYPKAFIDINMGCPVPKVALRAHAGSYLLKDIDKISEIVSAVVASVSCPVTVKIRSGWDENSINASIVAKTICQAGASAIAIHARTRKQGYSGKADWTVIKDVKDSVFCPVIGNGDILSGVDAKRMIDETGCDMVMIGRGCLGNPWLLKECVSYLENGILIEKPTCSDKIDMCLKHFDYLLDFMNEAQAVLEIRSHAAWYLKGIPLAKDIKMRLFKLKTKEEIVNLLLEFKESMLK